jgi:hypothetical protein
MSPVQLWFEAEYVEPEFSMLAGPRRMSFRLTRRVRHTYFFLFVIVAVLGLFLLLGRVYSRPFCVERVSVVRVLGTAVVVGLFWFQLVGLRFLILQAFCCVIIGRLVSQKGLSWA